MLEGPAAAAGALAPLFTPGRNSKQAFAINMFVIEVRVPVVYRGQPGGAGV